MKEVLKMVSNRENTILFDWFSMTSKIDDVSGIVFELGMLDCPFTDGRGSYGFKYKKYFEGISIHYGRDDGLVWLDMSGKGCRAFETYSSHKDWRQLFNLVVGDIENYHITRLDVAYDDYKGYLNQSKMLKYMQAGNIVTKFKDYGIEHQSLTKSDFTLFFGSNKSRTYIRCYNKAAERGVETEFPHWVRFEIQLRDESAFGFIREYMDCGLLGSVFYGVVANYLRFIEPSDNQQKCRWKTAKFWDKFIKDSEKISIYTKKDLEYNEGKLQDYVFGQAGQAINCAIDLYGTDGFVSGIVDYLNEHSQSKNPKYDELVERLTGGTPF